MRTCKFDCPRTCPHFEKLDFCRFNSLLQLAGVRTVVNSHVIAVDCEITNLDALKLAAERIGCTMNPAFTYKWFGEHMGDYALPAGFKADELGNCDYAISVNGAPDAYQCGVVFKNGNYKLLFDFWGVDGETLQNAIGENAQKLVDAYQLASAELAARQLGWNCETHGETLRVYHPSGGYLDIQPGNVEAFDFQGVGCHDAAQLMAQAMGKPAETTVKAEYFQNVQRVQQIGE